MLSGLGWYITKHSLGLWSSTPPPNGWHAPDMSDAQGTIDATALHVIEPTAASGVAAIDGYTVMHDRDTGPATVALFATTKDGRRVVARSDDAELAGAMSGGMFVDHQVELSPADDYARFQLQ